MSFYESRRAAYYMGVPEAADVTDSASADAKLKNGVLSLERSRRKEVRGRERLVDSVDRYLNGAGRHREVARTLYDAVMQTQIIDVHIDELQVGRMQFLRVPGTEYSPGGVKKRVTALWAYGRQENSDPDFVSHLVLVGSLDGETSADFGKESSKYGDFDFPSDPGFLTAILDEVLQLEVDYEDLEYSTGLGQPREGEQAAEALKITERGRGHGRRDTWVRNRFPLQRIVAIVHDIESIGEKGKIVLARPVIIDSTI